MDMFTKDINGKEYYHGFNSETVKALGIDDINYDTLKIGCYVKQEVVDEAMNMLPPRTMRSDCAQVGEPITSRYDEISGKWRSTYTTYKRAYNDIWEYCGDCFAGENKRRGKEMPEVR